MNSFISVVFATVWLVLLNNVTLESVPSPPTLHMQNQLTVEQSYCGSKLTNTMSQLCLETFSPHEEEIEHSKEKEIIEECCLNPCTMEKLLYDFCKTRNEEAIRRFLETGKMNNSVEKSKADKSARRKRRRSNRRRKRRNCKARRKYTKKEKHMLSRTVPHYIIGYNEYTNDLPLIMPMIQKDKGHWT